MKKLFGVPSDAEGFIGKIVDIFEGLTSDAGANWYDFGVGMGSIALLVLLKGNVCCYSNLDFIESTL